MRRLPKFVAFALLILALQHFSAVAQDVTFCALPLSDSVKQAHTSFNAIYAFDVGTDGAPQNIRAVEMRFTQLSDAKSCISKWRLPRSASTHLVAIFEWQHGTGWTKIAISGGATKLTVRLAGDTCSYPPVGGVGP